MGAKRACGADYGPDRGGQILAGLRADPACLSARFQWFGKWLDQIRKTDVLLLDDWGMAALDGQSRADLLEIIDDRASSRATIITSQLPIEHWHE